VPSLIGFFLGRCVVTTTNTPPLAWDFELCYNKHLATQQRKHTMQKTFNTTALAKLVYNKQKETYKIVCAFNVTERTENGTYKFPTQKKCDFVSGEFVYETITSDMQRIFATAKQLLRTNSIKLVS